MRFRDWFFESIMHGGLGNPFGSLGRDNSNMPVKSKYIGDGGQQTDSDPMQPSAEKTFGVGKFLDRKHSKERKSKRLNTSKRHVPIRIDVSDTS